MPRLGVLSLHDDERNRKITADCIVVENVFGRLKGFWNVLQSKWKWSETTYDKVYRSFVVFKELLTRRNQLCTEDGHCYNAMRNCLLAIIQDRNDRSKQSRQRYCENRRRRLQHDCPTDAYLMRVSVTMGKINFRKYVLHNYSLWNLPRNECLRLSTALL